MWYKVYRKLYDAEADAAGTLMLADARPRGEVARLKAPCDRTAHGDGAARSVIAQDSEMEFHVPSMRLSTAC